MADQTFDILLVEDDPDDVELVRQMLSRSRMPIRILTAPGGEEALAFLRREGRHAAAPRPDLVLLDLNMPRMDGRELLRLVKGDPDLKSIPVVILTTSNAADEIVKSYGLGANGYVSKPLGLGQFSQVVRVVEDYWIEIQQSRRRRSS